MEHAGNLIKKNEKYMTRSTNFEVFLYGIFLCKNVGGDMVGIVIVWLYCNVGGVYVWVLYCMDV